MALAVSDEVAEVGTCAGRDRQCQAKVLEAAVVLDEVNDGG